MRKLTLGCGLLRGICTVGMIAFALTAAAGTSVAVGRVESGEPWSKITVSYALEGVDAKTDYKVAFDVMAGGLTASVTNDAAKLANGVTNTVIDTVALFGRQVTDTKAKVRVTLIANKSKDLGGVQLWENGPFWAECNIGGTAREDSGNLFTFAEADSKVKELLGPEWRLPTKAELDKLIDAACCKREWNETKRGCTFTGMADGYRGNSIFMPAAGYDEGDGRSYIGDRGGYWSSTEAGSDNAWGLRFADTLAGTDDLSPNWGMSVRAVR